LTAVSVVTLASAYAFSDTEVTVVV